MARWRRAWTCIDLSGESGLTGLSASRPPDPIASRARQSVSCPLWPHDLLGSLVLKRVSSAMAPSHFVSDGQGRTGEEARSCVQAGRPAGIAPPPAADSHRRHRSGLQMPARLCRPPQGPSSQPSRPPGPVTSHAPARAQARLDRTTDLLEPALISLSFRKASLVARRYLAWLGAAHGSREQAQAKGPVLPLRLFAGRLSGLRTGARSWRRWHRGETGLTCHRPLSWFAV